MLHVLHELVLVFCLSALWNNKKHKGLAKLGNIIAETLLRMQMFPNLAARETCVAKTNFAARKQKMFAMESKTFLPPGHKFCVRNTCFPV